MQSGQHVCSLYQSGWNAMDRLDTCQQEDEQLVSVPQTLQWNYRCQCVGYVKEDSLSES